MNKNYIAYLLIGGAVYYYIVNKNKKDQLKKELEIKAAPPITQKKKIVNVVKKVLPVIKKLPVIKQKANKQQDVFFQSSILNKGLLEYVKTKPSVKKEEYKFPFLRPRSIKAIPSFPDMC